MPSPDPRLVLVSGDITLQEVDAIVNAANQTLRGGAGVDGAIHAAAGDGLLAECIERHADGCPVGEARVTGGHQLPSEHVIHTVGPIWYGGREGEPAQLASCYRSSVRLALHAGARTIAFPAISTGAFRYPMREAADVAVATLLDELARAPQLKEVRMVLYDEKALGVFREALEAISAV